MSDLQQLFANSILANCSEDYSEAQLDVWVNSGLNNNKLWRSLFTEQYLLVAEEQEKIIGFCSLKKNDYIDLLYVHKDHQGKGIASALYNKAEEKAMENGAMYVTADVSKTARYFFERVGFDILAEQTVVRQGVELDNFKMRKELI